MEDPMIMNKLKTSYWKLSSDRRILSRIEEIADRQKRTSRLVAEAGLKDNVLKELKEISEEIKERYNNVMKAYYTNDKNIAYGIEITDKDLIERCDHFLVKSSDEVCTGCIQNLKSNVNPSKKGNPEDLHNSLAKTIVAASKIAEHTKATVTFIKLIARTVLSMG